MSRIISESLKHVMGGCTIINRPILGFHLNDELDRGEEEHAVNPLFSGQAKKGWLPLQEILKSLWIK